MIGPFAVHENQSLNVFFLSIQLISVSSPVTKLAKNCHEYIFHCLKICIGKLPLGTLYKGGPVLGPTWQKVT